MSTQDFIFGCHPSMPHVHRPIAPAGTTLVIRQRPRHHSAIRTVIAAPSLRRRLPIFYSLERYHAEDCPAQDVVTDAHGSAIHGLAPA